MRKYTIIVCLLLLSSFFVTAQTWNDDMVTARQIVDSLKKELKTVKGEKRIDCLSLLSQTYNWIWDDNVKHLDSACMYADQAYELAKKSTYKRGLGYATLLKAQCFAGRVDENKNNNNAETNYTQAEKWAQQAIQIGEEIKDYRLVGDVYNMLKWMERWKGDTTKFKNYLKNAIANYEKPVTKTLTGLLNISKCDQCQGNEKSLANLHELLAGTYIQENNPLAQKEIDLAIHYYNIIGDKNSLGSLYQGLGQYYFLKYDYKNAIQAYVKSKESYHQSGNIEMEIAEMNELCKVYEVTDDFENGIAMSKKSISMAEDFFKNKPAGSAKTRSAGQAFFWMSRIYKIAGDYEAALVVNYRSRQYYPKDSGLRAPLMSEIGDTYRLLGNYDSAMFYLKSFQNADNNPNNFGKESLGYLYLDAKEYSKAQGLIFPYYQYLKSNLRFPFPIVKALNILGNVSLGEKKYEQALQYAKEAQTYLKTMGNKVLMINNYKLLSDIYEKMNKPDSAFANLKQYTRLKDSIVNRQFYFKLNSLKNESEEQKKTSQINLLNKDNQLKAQMLKQEASVKKGLIAGLILLFLFGIYVFRTLNLKRKNELKNQKLESEKKQAELQQKASELELQALRAQMNPHFIFNCLSSINKFILKNDTDAASDYLTRFSRLIRQSLTNSQLSLIPLSDEIEMLRLYLDMERLRFSESFNYNMVYENTIEPDTIYIPPMLLQPFCENAIWHGLMHKEGQGKLEIMMSVKNGELQCIIADNGVGREKAAELKSRSNGKQKSFGLKITTERLALFNAEKAVHSFYKTEDVLDANGNIAGTMVILNIKFKNSVQQPVKETV